MKHMHQNQEFRFNEVLFEHRNKQYGAYVLRNESDRILTKALFIGVSILAAISLTPLIANAFKSEPIKEPIYDGGHIFKPVITPEKDPPAPVKPQPVPEKIKTVDKTVPEPKAIVTNEKKLITLKDEQNAAAGIQTSEGKEVPTIKYVPIAPPITSGENTQQVVQPKVQPKEDNSPKTVVDVEASFVGGLDSFRNKVMNNFDGSGFDSGEVMKTMVTFIVEKDGTISGIKADGKDVDFNSEAMRTIKSIKGKWVPAKVNGQPVRSYFKFPISMKFDN
ncbi:energy transducer TonB [Chryseobacterium nepalense]|uniref:Energy transducer TonB n=1 Tax=Chryseobacterium nepalense TaxID=1854498 RepID=A0ABY4K8U1_9FLAO|nr:energy transducer TonB [Chryseobacterium nepalense]UPQ77193.1 energy transducer TonB [Chryseobacterium nepalense]